MTSKIDCRIQFGNGPDVLQPTFIHADTPFDIAIGHDVCKALGLDIRYSNRTVQQGELATPWLTNMQAYRLVQEVATLLMDRDFRLSSPPYPPV